LATKNAAYERRASATGSRLHWAQPGDRFALCGSVVVETIAVGSVLAPLVDCVACARKLPRVVASKG